MELKKTREKTVNKIYEIEELLTFISNKHKLEKKQRYLKNKDVNSYDIERINNKVSNWAQNVNVQKWIESLFRNKQRILTEEDIPEHLKHEIHNNMKKFKIRRG